MTGIGNRLGNIEQQKIVEKHIGIGGKRRGVQSGLPSCISQVAKLSFKRWRNSGRSPSAIANGVC